MERIKAVFNWSGGKDSAHALLRAQQSGEYEIVALLTTVNRDTHRSTMHGIPTALLQMQAESIGVPLYIVDLTPKGNMEDYDVAMSRAVEHFKTQGVTRFIFGDIFLHDVRKYREQQLSPHGIEIVEPLWGKSSEEVMNDFLVSGFRTVVVTTMADGLGADAIGRDRPRLHSLSACRSRSQWRKRRISYILLRRSDLPTARAVPAGPIFFTKLQHPPRRRNGENLFLLVCRPSSSKYKFGCRNRPCIRITRYILVTARILLR